MHDGVAALNGFRQGLQVVQVHLGKANGFLVDGGLLLGGGRSPVEAEHLVAQGHQVPDGEASHAATAARDCDDHLD